MKRLFSFNLLAVLFFALVLACNPEQSSNVNSKDGGGKVVQAQLAIEGMSCEMGCAKMIEKKLAAMPGMESAEVVFADNMAFIRYNNSQISDSKLKETIESLHGGDTYKITEIKVVSESNVTGNNTAPSHSNHEGENKKMKSKNIDFPNIFGLLKRFIPAN